MSDAEDLHLDPHGVREVTTVAYATEDDGESIAERVFSRVPDFSGARAARDNHEIGVLRGAGGHTDHSFRMCTTGACGKGVAKEYSMTTPLYNEELCIL